MFILPTKATINSSRGEEKLGKVPQRFQPASRNFFSRWESKRQCTTNRKTKEREDKAGMRKDR